MKTRPRKRPTAGVGIPVDLAQRIREAEVKLTAYEAALRDGARRLQLLEYDAASIRTVISHLMHEIGEHAPPVKGGA